MKLLNGQLVAQNIYRDIKQQVAKQDKKPTLAVILVGENPASKLYVSIKEKRCHETGIRIKIFKFPFDYTQGKLFSILNQFLISNFQNKIIKLIKKLNADKNITGIIVQLPLPEKLDTAKIIKSISPEKDVDGLNQGEKQKIYAPTAIGILQLLNFYKIELKNKNIVIVGKGKLVGAPLAKLLQEKIKPLNLQVLDSSTKNISQYTKQADILISATGVGHLIKASMIKKGAVVVDAGTSTSNGEIIGDVDFENVKNVASAITPSKGGVGPMTVAMLLSNLVNLDK